jgi:putative transcriptional regulator
VSPSAAIGLGRGSGPGFDALFDGIATLDLDPEHTTAQELSDLRIFVGYAGWGPGQLEQELDAGGWLVLDLEPDDPFTANPSELWARVLRRQGGRTAMFALAPEDPSTN